MDGYRQDHRHHAVPVLTTMSISRSQEHVIYAAYTHAQEADTHVSNLVSLIRELDEELTACQLRISELENLLEQERNRPE